MADAVQAAYQMEDEQKKKNTMRLPADIGFVWGKLPYGEFHLHKWTLPDAL